MHSAAAASSAAASDEHEEEAEEEEEGNAPEEEAGVEEGQLGVDSRPRPTSLYALWLLVAQSFARAPPLRVLMVSLGIGILRKDGTRQRRTELEASFASAMSQRNDSSMGAMALEMVPGLEEDLVDALHCEPVVAPSMYLASPSDPCISPPPPPLSEPRVGLRGKPNQLHLRQSEASTTSLGTPSWRRCGVIQRTPVVAES